MPAITIYLPREKFTQLDATARSRNIHANKLAQQFIIDGLKREGVIE